MARTSKSQRIIKAFLVISGVLAFFYAAGSIYLTLILAYRTPLSITRTPAALGLITAASHFSAALITCPCMPGSSREFCPMDT